MLPSLDDRGARFEFQMTETAARSAFGFFQVRLIWPFESTACSAVGAFGGVLSVVLGIEMAADCPAGDTLPTASIANTE